MCVFNVFVSHVVLGYIHCLPKLVILTLCAFPEHSSLSTHSHCFDLSTDYSFIYVWALLEHICVTFFVPIYVWCNARIVQAWFLCACVSSARLCDCCVQVLGLIHRTVRYVTVGFHVVCRYRSWVIIVSIRTFQNQTVSQHELPMYTQLIVYCFFSMRHWIRVLSNEKCCRFISRYEILWLFVYQEQQSWYETQTYIRCLAICVTSVVMIYFL